MDSIAQTKKPQPHAVCVPFPAQGHINPMLKLAKLLHNRGFHITFVNTEYNHRRLLKSRGPNSLDGLPTFRFETIPDGLPLSDGNATQDVPSLCNSTQNNCLVPFRELLYKLNDNSSSGVPSVSCIVSDGIMSFTLDVSAELGIPNVLFWTTSACGLVGYLQYGKLVDKGFTPLKDPSYLTNGNLDITIDWIPEMKDVRLKDLPSFIRTTDPNDIMLNFFIGEIEGVHKASAIILNTFHNLEPDVINSLSTIFPSIYTIGPLQFHSINNIENLSSIGSNLWKEESECLAWLDSKEPNSVVYVNFGSVTVMSPEHLIEFAWGLANSNQTFLWIIRPDLVIGDKSSILPPEFVIVTKKRGLLANWCPQEQVLNHQSIGGFLTHCGWNSMLESICGGVPMLCWPFFAEQQTNCWYSCTRLGIAMEIDSDVKREKVEVLVRELIDGEKGKEMKRKAMELKKLGEEAIACPDGSSYVNFEKMINSVLMSNNNNINTGSY